MLAYYTYFIIRKKLKIENLTINKYFKIVGYNL